MMDASRSATRRPTVKANLTRLLQTGLLVLALTGCLPASTNNIGQLAATGLLEKADYITLPYEEQSTEYSCGLACLVGVLNYWKTPVSQGRLLDQSPPQNTRTGYSVGELRTIAKSSNMQAFSLVGNTAFLEEQVKNGRPIIVPLEMPYNRYRFNFIHSIPLYGRFFAYVSERFAPSFSHFVTVFAVSPQTVWVMDPLFGAKPIPKKEFITMWEAKKNAMLLVAAT